VALSSPTSEKRFTEVKEINRPLFEKVDDVHKVLHVVLSFHIHEDIIRAGLYGHMQEGVHPWVIQYLGHLLQFNCGVTNCSTGKENWRLSETIERKVIGFLLLVVVKPMTSYGSKLI